MKLLEGAYDSLQPDEKQTLSVLDPSLRTGLTNLIHAMRSRGKQITLQQAAQQLNQILSMRGQSNPGLQKIAQRNSSNIPKPPQAIMNAKSNVQAPPEYILNPQKNMQAAEPNEYEQYIQNGQFNSEKAKQDMLAQGQQVNDYTNRLQNIGNEAQPPSREATQKARQKFKQKPAMVPVMKPLNKSGNIPQTNSYPQINAGERKSYAPEAFNKTMYPESKKIKNKAQLKEAVRNIVIQEQKRKSGIKILKEELKCQLKIRNRAKYLLSEGPMSNVWQKLKTAGSAVGNKIAGFGQDLSADSGQNAISDQQRQVMQGITKAVSKAHQQRQKFNSQVLKSAEVMNQYHEAVLRAFELYKQYGNMLGIAGQQVNRQINDLIEALQEDLMSEVSQIEAMIKSLGKKDNSIDSMLKTHKEKSAEKAEAEADLNPASVSRARHDLMMGPKGEKLPAKFTSMGNVRPQSTPKSENPKKVKKDTDADSLERIKLGDQSVFKDYEEKKKEMDDIYDEMMKDLTGRIYKSKDKEEKRNLMNQMYDLAKSKKERDKEIESKLKGIGIRSKAGKTALKNSMKTNIKDSDKDE